LGGVAYIHIDIDIDTEIHIGHRYQLSLEEGLADLFGPTFLPWAYANTRDFLPPAWNISKGPQLNGGQFDWWHWYWEANTAGSLQYPHAVKFVIGSYADMFGTEYGRQLQAWCMRWGWPLVWAFKGVGGADGVRPGRILDPVVLAQSRAGRNLTVPGSALGVFADAWRLVNSTIVEQGLTHDQLANNITLLQGWWGQLRNATPQVLRLEPLRGGACGVDARANCIGTNQQRDCVCY
jgi:hypothetical protein